MHNLTNDQTGHLIYLIALLAFLASGFIFRRKVKMSQVMRDLSLWFLIILVIVFLYSFRHDFNNVKNRLKAELFPSKATRIGENQIAIRRSENNHFYINLKVNDKNIKFLIDTGASDIALSIKDAKRVGINLDNLVYNKIYNTANGQIFGASVRLNKIELNGILFYDIRASVNNSDLQTSLLGMSFLNNFKKYEFYQDQLILTY